MLKRILLATALGIAALGGIADASAQQRAICYNCPPQWADCGSQLKAINAMNDAQRRMQQKTRFAPQGNPALRALYQPEAEPFTPAVEELVIPMKERKSIQTLTECSCRWPIGDPQSADFHFCGKNKVTGLPYCEFHARRAFQPPQPRRREREIAEPRIPALARASGKEPADL